jgi:hypothetical protein
MRKIDLKSNAIKLFKIIGVVGSIIGFILGCNQLYSFIKEKTIPELNGNYELKYLIKESTYKPYINLEITYEISLIQQKDGKIEGHGEKIKEYSDNKKTEKYYKSNEQSKIDIKGENSGLPITLIIIEAGKGGNSNCDITLNKIQNGHFEGSLKWDVAQQKGQVTLTKLGN